MYPIALQRVNFGRVPALLAKWRTSRRLVSNLRGVLVEHCPDAGLDWIEVPPFTTELKFAESLLPEGVLTFYRDARKVWDTALQVRALANEPPPLVSGIVHVRRG